VPKPARPARNSGQSNFPVRNKIRGRSPPRSPSLQRGRSNAAGYMGDPIQSRTAQAKQNDAGAVLRKQFGRRASDSGFENRKLKLASSIKGVSRASCERSKPAFPSPNRRVACRRHSSLLLWKSAESPWH